MARSGNCQTWWVGARKEEDILTGSVAERTERSCCNSILASSPAIPTEVWSVQVYPFVQCGQCSAPHRSREGRREASQCPVNRSFWKVSWGVLCTPTLLKSQQKRSPLPGSGVCVDKGNDFPIVVWPHGLREGGRFGGSVPGCCVSAPHLPGEMYRNRVQPAGIQLGAAESSGLAINVVGK